MSERFSAEINVHEPEKIHATLSITMALEDWQRLKAQLAETWPSWEVGSAIARLTERITCKIKTGHQQ